MMRPFRTRMSVLDALRFTFGVIQLQSFWRSVASERCRKWSSKMHADLTFVLKTHFVTWCHSTFPQGNDNSSTTHPKISILITLLIRCFSLGLSYVFLILAFSIETASNLLLRAYTLALLREDVPTPFLTEPLLCSFTRDVSRARAVLGRCFSDDLSEISIRM